MNKFTKRNPIARALRSPHLRPKVVKSKKLYSRKDNRQGKRFDGCSVF